MSTSKQTTDGLERRGRAPRAERREQPRKLASVEDTPRHVALEAPMHNGREARRNVRQEVRDGSNRGFQNGHKKFTK
jgi:hypothetical protein